MPDLHVELDDVDKAILRALIADGRRSVTDIADDVNLSPAPVRRRIDRLEQAGVIAGYTVVLNQQRIGHSLEALVELRFVGDAEIESVLEATTSVPQVRESMTTAGDPDAVVRVVVEDVVELQQVVNQLRRIPMVTSTKTLIVLDRRRSGSRATDHRLT